MEPVAKKTRLTDHFRVALKPRDLNVPNKLNQQQQPQQLNNQQQQKLPAGQHGKQIDPPGRAAEILDYDKALINNVYWEPHYASDSFEYDRLQEVKFQIRKYLHDRDQSKPEATQIAGADDDEVVEVTSSTTSPSLQRTATVVIEQDKEITPARRAELINWLVEIQVRFSLDHEPLYMAVKLADLYMMRKYVSNENLVLLYMTSMLISAKYDERVSPVTIPELIHVTKHKFGVRYTKRQIISLEVDLLTTLEFNIRFPLSYGFLRRFARCTRSNMRTINLARFILESSLMDYDMIEILDSKIAAGSLLLAYKLLNLNGAWNETAKFYTGYEERDLLPLIIKLNKMLLRLSRRSAVKRKYSHESTMEVARTPPMLPELLLLMLEDSSNRKTSVSSNSSSSSS